MEIELLEFQKEVDAEVEFVRNYNPSKAKEPAHVRLAVPAVIVDQYWLEFIRFAKDYNFSHRAQPLVYTMEGFWYWYANYKMGDADGNSR